MYTILKIPKTYVNPLADLTFIVYYGRDGDDLWLEHVYPGDSEEDILHLLSHSYYLQVAGKYRSLEDLLLDYLWEHLH